MLQAELGARTKELSEKVEQMHQQVRNYHNNIAHFNPLNPKQFVGVSCLLYLPLLLLAVQSPVSLNFYTVSLC